jgi:hypothetical protein
MNPFRFESRLPRVLSGFQIICLRFAELRKPKDCKVPTGLGFPVGRLTRRQASRGRFEFVLLWPGCQR